MHFHRLKMNKKRMDEWKKRKGNVFSFCMGCHVIHPDRQLHFAKKTISNPAMGTLMQGARPNPPGGHPGFGQPMPRYQGLPAAKWDAASRGVANAPTPPTISAHMGDEANKPVHSSQPVLPWPMGEQALIRQGQIAFLAREDKRIDRRSGVSQRLPIACLESAVSGAEQRAVRNQEARSSARIADVYAALPAITGKMELEYEGELHGAENIARELIRGAVGKVFTKYLEGANLLPVIQWFEMGGELKLPESAPASEALAQLKRIQGLMEQIERLGVSGRSGPAGMAAAAEFILEGLWAHKRISRSEERGFHADRPKAPEPREQHTRPPRRQFN